MVHKFILIRVRVMRNEYSGSQMVITTIGTITTALAIRCESRLYLEQTIIRSHKDGLNDINNDIGVHVMK
jgi:hypothetical protein